MTEAIIVGVLSLAGVILSSLIGNNKIMNQISTHEAVTDEKLAEMNRRLSEHNNLVSRMYAVEKDVSVLKVQIDDGK